MKDEMNILREVATTASAHGSNALSEILKKKVTLRLPEMAEVSSNCAVPQENSTDFVITVQSKIVNGLEGKIILVLEERSAFKLINLCYDAKVSSTSGFHTEMGLSVLKEIGNVVMGAYVGALSVFLNMVIVPAIPTLISGPLGEIVSASVTSMENNAIFLIDTVFESVEEQIKGRIYLVLTKEGRNLIQKACQRILDSLEK